MATPKTQGFSLSALPRSPSIPNNIGLIDIKAIDDGVRRGLATMEMIRRAPQEAVLADTIAREKIAQAPLSTEQAILANESAALANDAAVSAAPFRTAILASQADLAAAKASPEMIEAERQALLRRGIPAEVATFNALTAGMTPDQIRQAQQVKTGLQARPSSAAITYKEVVGSDGVTRLVAVDPRAVGAQVVGSAETFGSGVASTGGQGMTPAAENPQLFASPTIQQAATAKSEGEETAKARVEAQSKLPKVLSSLNALDAQTNQLEQDINAAIANVGPLTAGPAAATAAVPGSPARTLRAQLESIKARLGFQELQTMRQNSPTGGAVGNVSDYEGQQLQSTIARLDQGLGPETLKRFLERVKDVRREALRRSRDAYERDAEYFGIGQPMGQPTSPTATAVPTATEFKIIEVK